MQSLHIVRALVFAVCAMGLMATGAAEAWAQEQRFDVGFLTPSARQIDEGVGTAGATPLSPGHFEAHLLFEYASRPFSFRQFGADSRSAVVSAQMRANVLASVGILPRLELGLVLPLVHARSGDELAGFRDATLGGNLTGMGDVRLIPRVSLVDRQADSGWRASLALVADVSLPTGRERAFAASGFSGRPLLALQLEAPTGQHLLLNLGAALREGRTVNEVTRRSRASWSVAGSQPLGPVSNFRALLEVQGESDLSDFGTSTSQPIEARGALRWFNGSFSAQVGGGTRLLGRAGPPDWRVFASVGGTTPSRRPEVPTPEPVLEPVEVDEPVEVVEVVEPPVEEPVEVEEPWEIDERIYFAFGSHDPDARARDTLRDLARELRDRPDILLVNVEGHADNVGAPWVNRRVSRLRAEAARDFLVAEGVDPARLRVAFLGEDVPAADNDTEEGRALNRRVEFHILERTHE